MFSTYLKQEDDNIKFDQEEFEASVPLNFPEYDEFAERIRKTLYYGTLPTDERPSLPMSELAVGFFRDAAPKELGKADLYWAADVSSKAFISPCSMMLSMIYIERMKHKNPEYLLTVSSSDLFLISMMVASKFLYDEGVDEEVYNEEWAESAGMDTTDVNQLERDFLTAIDWSLFAEKEDFERVLTSMEERIAMSQALDRGSWTYSDLMVLLSNVTLQDSLRKVLEETLKVMLVCSLAYTAGGGTVLASMGTLNMLRDHMTPLGARMADHYNYNYTMSTESITGLLVENTQPQATESYGVPELDRKNQTAELLQSSASSSKDTAMLGGGYRGEAGFDSNESPSGGAEGLIIRSAGFPDNESQESIASTNSSSLASPYTAVRSGLSFPGFLTLALIKDTVSHIFGGKANVERDSVAILHNKFARGITVNDSEEGSGKNEGIRSGCSCPKCPLLTRGASRRRKWVRGQGVQNRGSSFLQCVFVPPLGLWSSLAQRKSKVKSGQGREVNLSQTGESSGGGEKGNSGKPGVVTAKKDQSEAADEKNGWGGDRWRLALVSGKGREGEGLAGAKRLHDGVKVISPQDKCGVKDERGEKRVLLPCRVESNFVELTSRLETSAHFAITR